MAVTESACRVEDSGPGRGLLTARSTATPKVAHPSGHPWSVVGANRVVVGDGAAVGDDRVAGGDFGGMPLLRDIATLPGDHGEVQRGAGGVDVGDGT